MVNELMEQGFKHRTAASTAMNDVSSRSHTVFTIQVHQQHFIASKKGQDAETWGTVSRRQLESRHSLLPLITPRHSLQRTQIYLSAQREQLKSLANKLKRQRMSHNNVQLPEH
jgi:hypothetical protein